MLAVYNAATRVDRDNGRPFSPAVAYKQRKQGKEKQANKITTQQPSGSIYLLTGCLTTRRGALHIFYIEKVFRRRVAIFYYYHYFFVSQSTFGRVRLSFYRSEE